MPVKHKYRIKSGKKGCYSKYDEIRKRKKKDFNMLKPILVLPMSQLFLYAYYSVYFISAVCGWKTPSLSRFFNSF